MILELRGGIQKLKSEEQHAMDMSTPDVVRDELIKSNSAFRDLVHQHQTYENRLSELAHLTFPSDDEQIEEVTLKKKKLQIKDEIYAMMHDYSVSH
ncbi:MAG: hypothetical protein DMF63_18415 [Acidobacteria bacterium]|nr:MAG: hypothetical protein DMF63_18415 [Acidobacteriota bacterium]